MSPIKAICTGCFAGLQDLTRENAPCPLCRMHGTEGRLRWLLLPISGPQFRRMSDEQRSDLKLRGITRMRGAA